MLIFFLIDLKTWHLYQTSYQTCSVFLSHTDTGERRWPSAWLAEQEVRDSIPGLATQISEIGYLQLPSRDMAEIPLKRRKSSIQPTNLTQVQETMTHVYNFFTIPHVTWSRVATNFEEWRSLFTIHTKGHYSIIWEQNCLEIFGIIIHIQLRLFYSLNCIKDDVILGYLEPVEWGLGSLPPRKLWKQDVFVKN